MAKLTCSEPDCDRPHKARGLCRGHYVKARRGGSVPPKLPPRADRHLLANVDVSSKLGDCSICGPQVPVRVRIRTRGNRICTDHQCATAARERSNRNAGKSRRRRGVPVWQPAEPKPGVRRKYRKRTTGERSISGRYWLTRAGFERMFEEQGGHCLICLAKYPKLYVDHDHVTGAIRGLLCHSCNIALGWLRDRVDVAERAVEYLRQHQEKAA